MYVILVDIAALMLIVVGISLVVRRPPPNGTQVAAAEGDARLYVRRIAGTMIAAFGFAIGLMVTLFHVLSQSA